MGEKRNKVLLEDPTFCKVEQGWPERLILMICRPAPSTPPTKTFSSARARRRTAIEWCEEEKDPVFRSRPACPPYIMDGGESIAAAYLPSRQYCAILTWSVCVHSVDGCHSIVGQRLQLIFIKGPLSIVVPTILPAHHGLTNGGTVSTCTHVLLMAKSLR